jgi:hypothetical protein
LVGPGREPVDIVEHPLESVKLVRRLRDPFLKPSWRVGDLPQEASPRITHIDARTTVRVRRDDRAPSIQRSAEASDWREYLGQHAEPFDPRALGTLARLRQ